MDNRLLSTEEIRDLAFRTTGQSRTSDWIAYRYSKAHVIEVWGRDQCDAQSSLNQHLCDDIYAQKNLDHVPAIKWGMDH